MDASECLLNVLSCLIIGTWVVHLLGFHCLAILFGLKRLHKAPKPLDPEDTPGVSIIKPLCGVDPHLMDNLRTFFTMTYPKFELLFCVADEADAAVMAVNALLDEFPKVDAKLFVGGKDVGVNPKICNMMPGYEAAKFPIFMISDAGLRMRPDTLHDMVGTMQEEQDVGLVHQLPYVCERPGFPGVYEKMFFGTQHPKLYLSAQAAGFVCVTGMSSMMLKHVVDQSGGLAAYADYVAEDFYIARDIRRKGYKLRLSHYVALQNCGTYNVKKHNDRLVRWARVRFAFMPHTIFLEPLMESVVLGTLVAWAVSWLLGWSPVAFFFVHMLLCFICDYILLRVCENGPPPFSKFELVVAWLFREFTSCIIHYRANRRWHIRWRNNWIRLKWGGRGERVSPALDV